MAGRDRGLRAHRRHADRGARRQGRLHRLAVRPALRLRRRVRRAPRRRPTTGAGCSRPAGGSARVERSYRDDTLVLETTFHTDDGVVRGHRLHADPRAAPSTSCASSRGSRAACRCTWTSASASTTATSCRGCARIDGRIRPIAGPNALVPRARRSDRRGAGYRTVADFVVEAGRRVPFVLAWYPSHEPLPRTGRRDAALSHDTVALVDEWARSRTYDGEYARLGACGRSSPSRRSPTRRPAASSPRRPRRCPSGSAACATGTTATAGCATRRSRSTR